jgi:acyl-CoA thioesterase
MTPQQIAERCAEIMWPDDHAARGLGMHIEAVGPGTATLTMTVRPDMVNGHGTCHGGFIFALADSTFAYACNSSNYRTVAAGVDINFVAPAHLGDRLSAAGIARQQGGRSGVYDIEVHNQDGKLIALFRGRSSRVKGHFFDDGSTPHAA